MGRAFYVLILPLLYLLSTSLPIFAQTQDERSEGETKPTLPPSEATLSPASVDTPPGYTINFNNVPIVEYLNFISKIGGMNFIYSETDLAFNVTIVSEEPTKLVNVMAALIQVLRINGFDLIEQGNNCIISRTGKVRQIATVVSQELPVEGSFVPPIMTRVFKVKNANPTILANMVRRLLSNEAIVEVSEETRHLIITDITQNIEQIHRLFLSLDIPQAPLDIDSYSTRNHSPEELIPLATQILTPISEKNPLIFVPQLSTDIIYIVSTPFLIEKAITILEDLDTPPSFTKRCKHPVTGQNILIYHIQNKPAEVLQNAIKQIADSLLQMENVSTNLTSTLENMKYIRESHSLFFSGDPQSLEELHTILNSLDTPYTQDEIDHLHGEFYFYKIQQSNATQITRTLEKIAQNLRQTPYSNQDLIDTMESVKWIKESDSLLFTGDAPSIEQLKRLLPTIDTLQEDSNLPRNNEFYSYAPIHETPEELLRQVGEYHDSLKAANLSDNAFMHTLASAKIVPSTKSIIFTGDTDSLSRIHTLVMSMDQPKDSSTKDFTVYVYRLQHVDPEYIVDTLKKLGGALPSNTPLAQAIDDMKYISEANVLVFRGTKDSVEHIKQILPTFDSVATAKENIENQGTYLIYQVQNVSGDELLMELGQTAKILQSSPSKDKELITSINNIRWIQSTNSLILTGTPSVLHKLKEIITTFFDIPRPEKGAFHVYKPKETPPETFREYMINTASEMEKMGMTDETLIHTMRSAKLVSNKSAVMFTGTPKSIERLKPLLQTFDTPKKEESKSNQFFIYKPKSIPIEQLKNDLVLSAKQMAKSGLEDKDLISALESVKTDPSQDFVIFVGTASAIEKIKVMIHIYDSKESTEKPSEYYIFNPIHQTPESVIKQAKHAADEMKNSGFADPNLIKALESATHVSKETGVLFTGTPNSIEQIKKIAPTFDPAQEPQASRFFVYKPIHITAELLQQQANKVALDMQNNGFSNSFMIHTLTNSSVIANGKALLLTGIPDSIEEVKSLLSTLDTLDEGEGAETTTFVVYKIKSVPGPTLMNFLRNMAQDLYSAGSQQHNLITTLNNMRYVKDTNSIIFTGTPNAIQEALTLAKQFDVPELSKETLVPPPSGFLIYQPKYMTGEDLIHILRDFKQNLIHSGIENKSLFDTITNLKWIEHSSSILIAGREEDMHKVLELLERFDIPIQKDSTAEETSEIDTISDMTFLIYKLQHNSGNEIRAAVKQIGDDLGRVKSAGNADLVESIKALQWVEATNSLIATGKPVTLGKLKELIKSIDVPAKQVFVEILVVETTMGGQHSFGLRWGSQGNFRDKFAYGTHMTPSDGKESKMKDPLMSFNQNLQKVSATTTPRGDFIPIASGFDLGVIGDIILHKGKSYFALGSLINALRQDNNATIMMSQKIITQDNKPSTIFIGQNLPYAGSVIVNKTYNETQTTNLEYRDVGVKLDITSTVGNGDVITLKIEQDISELIDTKQGHVSHDLSVSGIATSRTTTKTVASVPNKSVLVLSGSIQESKTHNRTSLPCLGGVPLIGAAFSDSNTNRNTQNILIFVRPHIISSFDTYAEITKRQEDIHRAQGNAEEFDAALELVKTPDDHY